MSDTPSPPITPGAVSSHYPRTLPISWADEKARYEIAKRFIDVSIAATVLLTALPLLLFIVALLQVSQGGPVLIRHRRVGRDGKPFRCLKFRSMVRDADHVLQNHLAGNADARAEWAAGRKLKMDPRITPLGRVLRKSSIDEFPQLLNVLRGEMSLVGPRPIVEAEVAHYGHHIQHYYRVRPGLTGRWQISGRSDVSYSARVRMDVEYVENRSIVQDAVILLRTFPVVLASRGSY